MRRNQNQAAVAVAIILTGGSGAALADDPPAPKAAESKFDEMLDSAGLTVSGYVAASYYASNGYPGNIHQFDVEHNTFQLDQAGFQHGPDGIRALLEGRYNVAVEDVTAVAKPALRHRILLNFEGEANEVSTDAVPSTAFCRRHCLALAGVF